MKIKFIILIIIAFLSLIASLIKCFTKKSIIEPYDDRKIDTSIKDCANFCKKTTGCVGFGYDNKNKVCYASKIPVIGRPVDGVYTAFHNDTDILCNKISSIKKIEKEYTQTALKANATFICTDPITNAITMYIHKNGEYKVIDDVDKYKNIPYTDKYKINEYKWALNTYSDDQINKSEDDRLSEVRQEEQIYEQKRQDTIKKSEEIINEQVKLGLGETTSSIQIQDVDKIITQQKQEQEQETNMKVRHVYKMSDKFSDGKYLKSHRCVKDITLKQCISYCTNNKDCVGVEWNPYYIKNKSEEVFDTNVCCPKATIGNLIERDDRHLHGKTYIKDTNHTSSKLNSYIAIE